MLLRFRHVCLRYAFRCYAMILRHVISLDDAFQRAMLLLRHFRHADTPLLPCRYYDMMPGVADRRRRLLPLRRRHFSFSS